MQKIGCGIVSTIFVAWLWPGMLLAKPKAPTPEELMARARKLTDIRAQGSPPFKLKGSVTIFGTPLGAIEGTYTLLWVSPEKWREELSLPGYKQVWLLLGNRMWQLRSDSDIPYKIFKLTQSLGYRSLLRPQAGEQFSKTRERKKKGIREWCFKFGQKDRGSGTDCFDISSGVLLSEGSYAGSTELSHYEPWGSKLFPRDIAVLVDNARIAEFKAEQLRGLGQPAPGTFSPPPGSTESTGCQDPVPPKLLKKSVPPYPQSAMEARASGSVLALAKVEIDGKIHDVHVVRSPSGVFNAAVLRALRSWEFRPASCQGTPVPSEIELEVNFRLAE